MKKPQKPLKSERTKRTYVVGKGWEPSEAEKKWNARVKRIDDVRREIANNKDDRIARKLRAEGYLEKAFAWHKRKSEPAKDFYQSEAWLKTRYAALIKYDGRCACCGASSADGIKLHVDHIKPRSKFPELATDLGNMQVLCEYCNISKSNIDSTDWRKTPLSSLDFKSMAGEYSDTNLSAFLSSL